MNAGLHGFLEGNIILQVMNPMLTSVLIVLIVVFSVISGVLTYITLKRRRILKILKNTRVNIARDLHDEIGATLSSISFYSEAARINLQNSNTTEAAKLLDKIGVSSRETIYSMNDIVWMINPKNDHLEKLFERIEDFGKGLFVSRGISFYFYLNSEIKHFILPILWRKNLYLITKEALNNAAKYANCSHVELLITGKNGFIEVVIKDDGDGFISDEIKEGNGLINMRVRAAEMGSKLHLVSNNKQGTAISFSVPYPPKW